MVKLTSSTVKKSKPVKAKKEIKINFRLGPYSCKSIIIGTPSPGKLSEIFGKVNVKRSSCYEYDDVKLTSELLRSIVRRFKTVDHLQNALAGNYLPVLEEGTEQVYEECRTEHDDRNYFMWRKAIIIMRLQMHFIEEFQSRDDYYNVAIKNQRGGGVKETRHSIVGELIPLPHSFGTAMVQPPLLQGTTQAIHGDNTYANLNVTYKVIGVCKLESARTWETADAKVKDGLDGTFFKEKGYAWNDDYSQWLSPTDLAILPEEGL